jgi:hypothetical protein
MKVNLKDKKRFLRERVLKKAMYKEFQEAVEIASDLAAMIVKDAGKWWRMTIRTFKGHVNCSAWKRLLNTYKRQMASETYLSLSTTT